MVVAEGVFDLDIRRIVTDSDLDGVAWEGGYLSGGRGVRPDQLA